MLSTAFLIAVVPFLDELISDLKMWFDNRLKVIQNKRLKQKALNPRDRLKVIEMMNSIENKSLEELKNKTDKINDLSNDIKKLQEDILKRDTNLKENHDKIIQLNSQIKSKETKMLKDQEQIEKDKKQLNKALDSEKLKSSTLYAVFQKAVLPKLAPIVKIDSNIDYFRRMVELSRFVPNSSNDAKVMVLDILGSTAPTYSTGITAEALDKRAMQSNYVLTITEIIKILKDLEKEDIIIQKNPGSYLLTDNYHLIHLMMELNIVGIMRNHLGVG